MKIAIIGAGLAGLTLAKKLHNVADVTIFDKSHSVGGRMSARVKDGFCFDHGAQYFSVKSADFQAFLEPYLATGVVESWAPNMVTIKADGALEPVVWQQPRYVASPHMRALCEAIAEDLKVELKCDIVSVQKKHGCEADGPWQLTSSDGVCFSTFDWVVSAIPSHQIEQLMPKMFTHELSAVEMAGCYALIVGLNKPLPLPFDAALIEASGDNRPDSRPDSGPQMGQVSFISLNSTKPHRQGGYSLLLQSSNQWANSRLDDDKDDISAQMITAFETMTGLTLEVPAYLELHKWRFANVTKPAGKAYLLNEPQKAAAIGDWCLFGKVEAAFASGAAFADYLKSQLH